MSFALELWWIVDAGRISKYQDPGDLKEYRLPIPAYVLALAYFRYGIICLFLVWEINF